MNLRVELGDVSCPHAQHPHHQRSFNGPARQRRRLRRAEEQEAEKAKENGKAIVEEANEVVKNDRAEEADLPAKDIINESETLGEEFCWDESFERASDKDLVEMILVRADCQVDWSDNVVTNMFDEKL